MTKSRIRKIDARFFNERAMRVYEQSDQGALEMMLEALSDHASDEDVADELESFYNDLFQDDEDDLMDSDLEDQLAILLAEGDKEDAKFPRHGIDDLERRYVLLTKLNGRYLTDMASDDLNEISRLKDVAYDRLSSSIYRDGQGIATITIFDREGDRDLYHVELCKYPAPGVSKFEQAIKGVEAWQC